MWVVSGWTVEEEYIDIIGIKRKWMMLTWTRMLYCSTTRRP